MIIVIIITFFNVITFRSFIVIWLLAIFLSAKTKFAKFLTLDLRVTGTMAFICGHHR